MFRRATFLLLAVALVAAGQTPRKQRDYVPDEKTAVQIAQALLIAQFGEERVNAELPLHASGSNKDRWIVSGTRPRSANGMIKKGGGLTVWINKHSGCIENVTEYMK